MGPHYTTYWYMRHTVTEAMFQQWANCRLKFPHLLAISVARPQKPCDFWLWGYFKSAVYVDNLNNLAKLKDVIRWAYAVFPLGGAQ